MHRFVSWLLCGSEIAEGCKTVRSTVLEVYYTISHATMAACCFVAVGIIWWEVICHGLLPGNVVGPSVNSLLFSLAVGAFIIFGFLLLRLGLIFAIE